MIEPSALESRNCSILGALVERRTAFGDPEGPGVVSGCKIADRDAVVDMGLEANKCTTVPVLLALLEEHIVGVDIESS